MRIRMYNVGFGDCFCIRDRKSSLLVDFGAANSKIEGRPRRDSSSKIRRFPHCIMNSILLKCSKDVNLFLIFL